MTDNEAVLAACISRDARIEIASPVSIALHPSGEMDVLFFDAASGNAQKVKERIRFSPLAAAQFLDAINAAAESGHITFGSSSDESLH